MTYGFDTEKSRINNSSTYKKTKQSYPIYEPNINVRNITEKRNSKLNTLRNITQKKQHGGRGIASRAAIDKTAAAITSRNMKASARRSRVDAARNRYGYSKRTNDAVKFVFNENPSASDNILESIQESARAKLEQERAFVRERAIQNIGVTPVVASQYADPINFDNSTGSQLALVRMAMITEESRQIQLYNRGFQQGLLSLVGKDIGNVDTSFIPGNGLPNSENSLEVDNLRDAIAQILMVIENAADNAHKSEQDFIRFTAELNTENNTVHIPLINEINAISQSIVNKIFSIYSDSDSLIESIVNVNKNILDYSREFNSLSSRLDEIIDTISNTPDSIDISKALNDYNTALTEYTNYISPPVNTSADTMNTIRNNILIKLSLIRDDLITRNGNIEKSKIQAKTQLDTASSAIKDIPGQKEQATKDFFEKIPNGLSQTDINNYRADMKTYETAVGKRTGYTNESSRLTDSLRPPNDHSNLESLNTDVKTAYDNLNDPTIGLIAVTERLKDQLRPTDTTPVLQLVPNLDPETLITAERLKLDGPSKILGDTLIDVSVINKFLKNNLEPTKNSWNTLRSEITVSDPPTTQTIDEIKKNIGTARTNYNSRIAVLLKEVSSGFRTLYSISESQNDSKKGEKRTAKSKCCKNTIHNKFTIRYSRTI